MPVTTISSRKFLLDPGRSMRASRNGAVVITARGRPAHVLMTTEHYQRLTARCMSVADALAQPGVDDIEFKPPRMGDGLFRTVGQTRLDATRSDIERGANSGSGIPADKVFEKVRKQIADAAAEDDG